MRRRRREEGFVITRLSLFVLGSAFVLYALIISFFTKFGFGHLVFLLLAAPLLIWAIGYDALSAWARGGAGAAVLFFLRAGYAVFGLALAVAMGLMASAASAKPAPGADALIVLGAGLRGERVSLTLQHRLDAAYGYLTDNPGALCVLSGGQGHDEAIPEAVAMRRYLQGRGIAPERIFEESRSANTDQNIRFSRELLLNHLGREPNVVIVTSDFHLFRGTHLARGAGFPSPQGLASPSKPYLLPVFAVREVFSIAKDGVLGRYLVNEPVERP